VEALGAEHERGAGEDFRCSFPHPLTWHRQARTRGTGRAFPSFFLLLISLGASTLSWDRPGRRAKGELVTSRHCADCGREKLGKIYTVIIYIHRMQV